MGAVLSSLPSCAPAHDPLCLPALRRQGDPPPAFATRLAVATFPLPADAAGGLSETAADRAGRGIFPLFPAAPQSAPVLPGTGPGGSIASVLQRRLSHIAHGHTPHQDLALRPCALPRRAREQLQFAVEDMNLRPPVDCPDKARTLRRKALQRARHKLVKAAAYLLAAIDRIDLQLEQEGTTHD